MARPGRKPRDLDRELIARDRAYHAMRQITRCPLWEATCHLCDRVYGPLVAQPHGYTLPRCPYPDCGGTLLWDLFSDPERSRTLALMRNPGIAA
jgi:hypothetical protein